MRQKQIKDVKTHFCGLDCKAEWQRRQRPVSVEWLRQKYVDEGLDCTQIAALVNRHPKSVWFWLRGSHIETRTRGGKTSPGSFKKGGHNPFAGCSHSDQTRAKIRAARLADGRVPYLKNGIHHLKGKRGAETPNWKGGVTPERQEFYRSEEWKLACKTVWQLADARCEKCRLDHRKIDRSVIKFHVHHIVSFRYRPLRAEPSNLALLCDKCHRFVHSKLNTDRLFLKEPPCQ